MKSTHVFDNLVCPKCHSFLNIKDDKLVCPSCKGCHSIVNGIPDLRNKDGYWCNVSREKMQELNRLAEHTGDWLGAAKKIVPQYMNNFASFNRADSQFLWPCVKNSRILDAGSMWGGITIPAAQFHNEVYAVDKTMETLEFLKIRAQQMNFTNIYAVASGLQNLPFPDGFFDLVVLNGVLEWVAFDEEVALERQWKGFGRGLRFEKGTRYLEDPRTMQLRVLKEMKRVLKPGGCLYLAIENKIGYIYLAGYPDGHMNIPFVSFMPRFIANAITKLILNCEYRTYLYTIPGYKSLLAQSGFGNIDFYGAFMHYITPSEVIPLDLIKGLKEKILSTKGVLNRTLLRLFPKSFLKWFSPSIIAIAATNSSKPYTKPRLAQLLEKAGILSNGSSDIKIVRCDSRPGNDLTVNHWVYTGIKDRPRYFCKICRSKESIGILDAESKNLKTVNLLLEKTGLNRNIPKLLYYGTIDDITFMVTEFIEARNSAFNFNSRLKVKLKSLDRENKIAIAFLANFQKYTMSRKVKAAPYLMLFLEDKKKILKERGLLTKNVEKSLYKLQEEISQFKDIVIPLCAQHGDYDFCNTLFAKDGIRIVDFEHFQREALPFLDLATLLFNPILVSREYRKKGLSFNALLNRYSLKKYIDDWSNLYIKLSGMPRELLYLIPPLAALEQMTKEYPSYRNPETFPINRTFEEFLMLRIPF